MIPRLTTKTVVGQRTYNFSFDYIARDFIKVEIDGRLLEYDKDYTVNGRTVNLVVAPTEVKPLYIYRETATIPLVEWKDSSIMTARDLNLQQTQTAHLTEELVDTAEQTRRVLDDTKQLKTDIANDNAALAELAKSIVSVKLFGAVGDGVTDDTKAFKTANNNLSGKILLIPKGNYVIQEHMSFNTVSDVMDYGTYTYIKPFYPNETPMLQGASNIAKLGEFTYDEGVNQIQGFTYNEKKDVFVLACINSESTVQHIYEVNADTLQRTNKYTFEDERLGHCNTMAYNKYTDKIYVTNGKANGNNITVLNANTMQIEDTITLSERVFNLAYDPITRTYASIVPVAGSQRLREVNLYGDTFKRYKSYQIDYEYNDFNNNGALMLNGAIMSATLGSLVEITPFGQLKQIIEFNPKFEIEDIAYRKGKFYFAVLIMQPNKKHKVEIYIGNPSKSFENSLATQQLEASFLKTTGGNLTGAPILANNISFQAKDTKGSAHHLFRITDKDNFEIGMADTRLIFVGKTLEVYDRTKNKTTRVLNELDIGETILSKAKADEAYFPKAGGEVSGAIILPNGISVQAKDSKGSAHHVFRITNGNNLEIGMADTRTIFVGKTLENYDRSDGRIYNILTAKDAYLKAEVDTKLTEIRNSVGTAFNQTQADARYLQLSGGSLTGALILPNNTSLQAKDSKGGSHHVFRITNKDNLEIGMADTRTLFVGKTFEYFDRTDNQTYRVATEKDLRNILTSETVNTKVAEAKTELEGKINQVKTQTEAKADKATTESKLTELENKIVTKADTAGLSIYLPKSEASTTYLSKADAETTYAKKSEIPTGGGGGATEPQAHFTVVSTATDWNTFTNTGVYQIKVAGGANAPSQAPWGVTIPDGFLKVVNYGNGQFIEQYFYTNNGEVYYRVYGTPRWRSWGRVQTSLNGTVRLYGGKELK